MHDGHREREVKLALRPDAELPAPDVLLADLGPWTDEVVHQEAIYFDTPDLRLTRSGVSLRWRSDDGWTVKTPVRADGAAIARTEHAVAGPPGSPPAAAQALVRGWTRMAAVGEVARVVTTRHRLRAFAPTGMAVEVCDDVVRTESVMAASTTFREIEVELGAGGDDATVETVVARLREAGAEARDPVPKVVRALGPPAREPADLARPGRVRPTATLGELVGAALADSVLDLVEADHRLRLGDDPDAVHDARVATRRLRSDLRTFAPVLDAAHNDTHRAELQWLGHRLGRVRDADVLEDRIRARGESLDAQDLASVDAILRRLRETSRSDREALADTIDLPRYARLLEDLVAAARAPELRDDLAGRPARPVARRLVRRPWRKLRRVVTTLSADPTDAGLHEVRKRTKHLRYAAEAVAPVVGKRARKLADAASGLQTQLGEQHDAVVAAAWLRTAAEWAADRSEAFVAGELAARFTQDASDLRRGWRRRWKTIRRRYARL
ncbi:MAG: CHAD domain-containing protein [Acidimicrobiia bacterium]